MKVKESKTTLKNKIKSDDVKLFPAGIRIAIIFAFICVIVAIIGTVVYTINQIVHPL